MFFPAKGISIFKRRPHQVFDSWILEELAGYRDGVAGGGCGHARTDVMQLRRIDHIQPVVAHSLKAGQDFIHRRVHDTFAALVTGEIEI